MSRLVRRSIDVMTKDGRPHIVIDGDNTYSVNAIIDWWMEAGSWWDGESPRTMYRVQTQEGFVFDLEFSAGTWQIYRVWD